jgi:CheY-like chemotaxis protein
MKDDYKILLVDDSESDRGICRRYLLADEDFDYQIIEAESLEEGLALWRSRSPDLVLTDIHQENTPKTKISRDHDDGAGG